MVEEVEAEEAVVMVMTRVVMLEVVMVRTAVKMWVVAMVRTRATMWVVVTVRMRLTTWVVVMAISSMGEGLSAARMGPVLVAGVLVRGMAAALVWNREILGRIHTPDLRLWRLQKAGTHRVPKCRCSRPTVCLITKIQFSIFDNSF
jgi:hypothetical protein